MAGSYIWPWGAPRGVQNDPFLDPFWDPLFEEPWLRTRDLAQKGSFWGSKIGVKMTPWGAPGRPLGPFL